MFDICWMSFMFGLAVGVVCATLALVMAEAVDDAREKGRNDSRHR